MRLSELQRTALADVDTYPGRYPTAYPGGARTIRSLAKRGLVRIEATRRGDYITHHVFPAGHVHEFRFTGHMDGCHWWVTTAECECGASHRQTCEREPNDGGDIYASVWMIDADGAPMCDRCEELLDGAEPESKLETFMPDGSAVPA